jgi:hypothetical protein
MYRPDNLRREKVGSKWRWVWENWQSAPFDELEERPWTPFVIDGRLCFSARDKGQWHVIFGDEVSPAYDDAFGTMEWQSLPLYIACLGGDWFVVWGSKRSQTFRFQINFTTTDTAVLIKPFQQPNIDGGSNSIEAQWSESPHS